VHGWIHESPPPAREERELIQRAVDTLTHLTGVRPVGYRAPFWNPSPNSISIIRSLGFVYESSLMADDDPYELVSDGQPTGLVELPVSWILDDLPALDPRGEHSMAPADVLGAWIAEFDRAYAEGGMFLLTLHPQVIGRRSRIVLLEQLLDHMHRRPGVWFATGRAAAEYLKQTAGQ
jgi:peptidoglycan/xylan/chitin deacetylase (PgdA/CDA1 family)